ncbi:MAG TPA: alpha/beta hydrolase [Tepidisphaeraceae bacterium]|jgi:acetyl esterase/lipase|nr:alpha/beta hydrolase [Tepidisphaeraceae bacterium]
MIHSSIQTGLLLLAILTVGCATHPAPRPTTEPVPLAAQTTAIPTPLGMKPVPTLQAFFPEQNTTHTAVVVCPGGGYSGLMDTYEGQDVCRWWNRHGVTAYLLRYRVSPNRYPAQLNDAQAAIKMVRQQAKSLDINPKHIGIMGFSAGGHLAGSAATLFHNKSDRPDFAILVYPVISMIPPYAHGGSRDSLLGKNFAPGLDQQLSLQLRVTDNTPPCFLVQGKNDKVVPWQNAQMFADALTAHGIKNELVFLNNGPHGFGLRTPNPAEGDWTLQCLQFLQTIKMLPANPEQK